jgi:hypothetical protein
MRARIGDRAVCGVIDERIGDSGYQGGRSFRWKVSHAPSQSYLVLLGKPR